MYAYCVFSFYRVFMHSYSAYDCIVRTVSRMLGNERPTLDIQLSLRGGQVERGASGGLSVWFRRE